MRLGPLGQCEILTSHERFRWESVEKMTSVEGKSLLDRNQFWHMVWQKRLSRAKMEAAGSFRIIEDSHINCQPKLPKLIRCHNVGMAKCEFEFDILHEITLGPQTLH